MTEISVRRQQTDDSAELPEGWGHPRKRPRGRPSADKGMLCGDRDELVGLLSAMWADIGWELLHAKTTADIRHALAPLKGDSRHSRMDHFLRESSSNATAAEVRATAAASSSKHARRIKAQTRCDVLRKSFDEVQLAHSQATAEQLAAIAPILDQRRANYESAEVELKTAAKEEKNAEAKLADQEAGFAQRELLKFIRSGKYAHNPLNLANAMAGIRCHTSDGMRVHTGCWQSHAQCSKLECTIWPTYQFQRFETIKSIWNRRHKSSDGGYHGKSDWRIRRGGVWPGNETLGLPSGLNQRPLNILGALGLFPGLECGDFVACGSLDTSSYTAGTLTWGTRIAVGSVRVMTAVTGLVFEILLMQQSDAAPQEVRVEHACSERLLECLNNPWQPWWNVSRFGKRKDCGACYRECKHAEGGWPEYKCPR